MMMEREWCLGVDLHEDDCLCDPITFRELILTVHCNCREINPQNVRKELKKIIEIHQQDMDYLLEKNMDLIIQEAMKGRE